MMRAYLDPTSRQPIYQQLVDQLRMQIASGELADGTRLPSVRELALELRINPNTVARAYRELEQDGFVVLQQGRGVFVTHRSPRLSAAERRQALQGPLDELLIAGWKLGLGLAELIAELERRAGELFPESATESGPTASGPTASGSTASEFTAKETES